MNKEHEELEAVVQTARKALEQHELELDGASTALEAAERELNQVPWARELLPTVMLSKH